MKAVRPAAASHMAIERIPPAAPFRPTELDRPPLFSTSPPLRIKGPRSEGIAAAVVPAVRCPCRRRQMLAPVCVRSLVRPFSAAFKSPAWHQGPNERERTNERASIGHFGQLRRLASWPSFRVSDLSERERERERETPFLPFQSLDYHLRARSSHDLRRYVCSALCLCSVLCLGQLATPSTRAAVGNCEQPANSTRT